MITDLFNELDVLQYYVIPLAHSHTQFRPPLCYPDSINLPLPLPTPPNKTDPEFNSACRCFFNRKIIIHDTIFVSSPVVLLGKTALARAICPFSTRVKHSCNTKERHLPEITLSDATVTGHFRTVFEENVFKEITCL